MHDIADLMIDVSRRQTPCNECRGRCDPPRRGGGPSYAGQMPLRCVGGETETIGSLALFADLDDLRSEWTLQDVRRQKEVLDRISHGLSDSLSRESTLHGWRAQKLFEAVVVELDRVQLITFRDIGSTWSRDPVKRPDFEVVSETGERLMVEIKNVAPGRTTDSCSQGEVVDLERFADLADARLLFAHYWTTLNVWTLVDRSVLSCERRRCSLSLETAMLANEMSFLGDRMLATTSPLTMRLVADKGQPRSLRPSGPGTREGVFTVADVQLLVGDRAITDAQERELAFFMMFYGGWELEEPANLDAAGEIESVDWRFSAIDDDRSPEEHRLVGALSSLYSTAFNLATLRDGRVIRLRHEPAPGALSALVPEDYWSRGDRVLPLWQFEVRPAWARAHQSRPHRLRSPSSANQALRS